MTDKKNEESQHVEHAAAGDASVEELTLNWVTTAENARLATHEEHRMTLLQAIKMYPKACLWSMVISITIIMDGYDTALLASLSAFPSFRDRFGVYINQESGYQIPANWQVALGCSSTIGNIIGIYVGAMTTDRLGYRKSLLFWLTLLIGFIFISFFGQSIQMLFVGELLSGLPWGVFTTMAPAFASEVCPVVLRGYLEIFVVLCWGIGQFLSYSVLLTLNTELSQWGWRIPFGVQWVWPTIIIPLILFAPESPWWLVRKDRIEEAEKSVKRLSSGMDEAAVKRAVALMIETNKREKEMVEGVGYIDCFRDTNLRRTEISCLAWAIQTLSGFIINAYSTYFFEQAGLPSSEAYKISVGMGGLHFLFTLLCGPLTAVVGRRRIYLCGLAWMCAMMFIIGFLALAPQTTAIGYASSVVFLLWYCCYELTLGPVAYIIVGEVSSTRLRAKTVGLARNAYNIVSLIQFFVTPYVLNPGEGNWKGKSGFLTGGIIIFCILWAYFRLPETKGRTYEELDILFAKRLKTREFKNYPVDVVGHEEENK